MLEALGDDSADAQVVERAKAASQVANSFIGAVKVEINAMRLADEIGILPTSVDAQVLPGRQRQLAAVK
jgi:hypothetical protein